MVNYDKRQSWFGAVEKEDLILLRDWRNLTDFRKHFRAWESCL